MKLIKNTLFVSLAIILLMSPLASACADISEKVEAQTQEQKLTQDAEKERERRSLASVKNITTALTGVGLFLFTSSLNNQIYEQSTFASTLNTNQTQHLNVLSLLAHISFILGNTCFLSVVLGEHPETKKGEEANSWLHWLSKVIAIGGLVITG